jgi:hypothetical protein
METSMNNISIEKLFNLDQTTAFQPLPPINQTSIVRVDDTLICSGTVPMVTPETAKHVRVADLRLPPFAQKPSVTATLYSLESVGTTFVIYGIKVNKLSNNQTQIAIAATNTIIGGASDLPFFVDFVVIGKAA